MFDNQVRKEENDERGQLMNVTHPMIFDFSDSQRLVSFHSNRNEHETRVKGETQSKSRNRREKKMKENVRRTNKRTID